MYAVHRSNTERRARVQSTGSGSGAGGGGRGLGERQLSHDCNHYRVVVLGAGGVGKTSLVSRFLYGTCPSGHRPTVDELHNGRFDINGLRLSVDLLDTSGTLEFPAMRRLAIATGDAFLLIYSADDVVTSFEEVRRLRDMIVDATVARNNNTCKGGGHTTSSSDIVASSATDGQNDVMLPPIVVVANKSDVNEYRPAMAVAASKAAIVSKVKGEWGCGYVETSAKGDEGVEEVFRELLIQARGRLPLTRQSVKKRSESASSPSSRHGNNSISCHHRNNCRIS